MAYGSRSKCPECVRPYDEIIFTPMLLKCNHCFCKPCITRFIQTNGLCAICQNPIAQNFRDVPVYQMGVRDIRTCKEKQNIRKECLEKMKFLLKFIEGILVVISPVTTTAMVLQVNISKLKEILQKDPPLEEMKTMFNQIVNNSNEIHRGLRNMKMSCYLRFTVQKEFLQKLHSGLQNGQTVYTFYQISNEIKYGRISICTDAVLFHCLDLSEVKISSGLIRFDKLKQYLCLTRILPFVVITLRECETSLVFFEMFRDQREQVNLFINLCTGEKGISYKRFCQFGVVHVAHGNPSQNCGDRILVVENHENEAIRIDDVSNNCYNGLHRNEATESESIFVELSGNGSFALYSTSNPTGLPNYIGKVLLPQTLSETLKHTDVPVAKIVDCGVAVPF